MSRKKFINPGKKITQEEKEEYARQFESLTIQDDFMFCKVMEDEVSCEKVLKYLVERLLQTRKDKA